MKRDDRNVQCAGMGSDEIERMTERGRALHDRFIGSLLAAGARRVHDMFTSNKTAVPVKGGLKYS